MDVYEDGNERWSRVREEGIGKTYVGERRGGDGRSPLLFNLLQKKIKQG